MGTRRERRVGFKSFGTELLWSNCLSTTINLFPPTQTFSQPGYLLRVMISMWNIVNNCWHISIVSRYIMKDREDYFTGAQRSQIVWQILLRTPYDVTRPDKVRTLVDIIFPSSILISLYRLVWWGSSTRTWWRPASPCTRADMISMAPRGRRVTDGWD